MLIPFATRYLGPERFGIYALATTIMYFIFLLNDLGINTYVIREVSKDITNAKFYYSNSLSAKVLFILIDFLILLIFVALLNFSKEVSLAILIFAIYGFLTSIFELNASIFRAHERMEFETFVIILEKVITTGTGIYVLVKGWGLFAFSGVFVLGGLISILVSTILVKKYFCDVTLAFDFKFIKSLVASSLPFGISLFLAHIYNSTGIIFLSKMQPSSVVGWFSAACRLLNFTNIMPMVLYIAIFPALSREVIQSKEKFSELFTKGFKFIFFLAIPIVAGIIILSENIAIIIFGEEFTNSIAVLRIIAWAAGLIFFNIYFTCIFNAANYQKTLVIIQVFALILNIILNLFLIPKYAHIGAAIAMVATEAAIFITCIVFAYRKISHLQEFSFIPKAFGATCIMSVFALLLRNFNIIAAIIIPVLIYFSVLYLFKGFVLEEILMIRKQKYSTG